MTRDGAPGPVARMMLVVAVTVTMVVVTIVLVYEVLRLTSLHLAELPVPPRMRVVVVVLACFLAHSLAVVAYGLAYWWLTSANPSEGFSGLPVEGLSDALYFSSVTYTSLGFGDVMPLGPIRLLAGVEALQGLLLIGWTASFTYLVMERTWPLHAGSIAQGSPEDPVRVNPDEAA